MGRVYKQLQEEMQLLWSESLRLNTVHVEDVSRATWHVANWFVENGKVGSGETFVFNLADKGDTSEYCLSDFFFLKKRKLWNQGGHVDIDTDGIFTIDDMELEGSGVAEENRLLLMTYLECDGKNTIEQSCLI